MTRISVIEPGDMPIPEDVLVYQQERLRLRAERDGQPFGHDLAVASVYEISGFLDRLLPFPWYVSLQ